MFVINKMVHQLKFKLHRHCSSNQGEQIAILKVLEKLEELQDEQDDEKTRCNLHWQQEKFGFIAKQI